MVTNEAMGVATVEVGVVATLMKADGMATIAEGPPKAIKRDGTTPTSNSSSEPAAGWLYG